MKNQVRKTAKQHNPDPLMQKQGWARQWGKLGIFQIMTPFPLGEKLPKYPLCTPRFG